VGSTSHLQNPLLQMIRALANTIKIHISRLGSSQSLLALGLPQFPEKYAAH